MGGGLGVARFALQVPLSAVAVAYRGWRGLAARQGVGYAVRRGVLGRGAWVDPSVTVLNSTIGGSTRIEHHCVITDSVLDEYCQIGPNSMIANSKVAAYLSATGAADLQRTDIGKFCSIASCVIIGATRHPMERVSTHAFTYLKGFGGFLSEDDDTQAAEYALSRVSVGNDVFIGAQTIVLPGVRIGDGAVISAKSVVCRDVSPYAVVAGVPARQIQNRFPNDHIEQLMRIRWWDWDRETIRERVADFADISCFISKYGV